METFNAIWTLLSPSGEYVSRKDACRTLWGTLSLARQRQIYWYLREAIKRGDGIDENPYFAINNCTPQPTNWNGRQGINEMMKTEKMVIAKYNGSYGTYTAGVARLFEMTDIKPLNF